MICLLGSTNSKLISSSACFTYRIRILIKHNEPSLQEISTKRNYWNQEAGCNNSPLSTSPLWPCADNLTETPRIWNYELHLKHTIHWETFVLYWQLSMLECVAAYVTFLTTITWIILHAFLKTGIFVVLQSLQKLTPGEANYYRFPQGGTVPFVKYSTKPAIKKLFFPQMYWPMSWIALRSLTHL